jgi:UDP-2-acetamido-3-amino-2,3-dideoxy-glucuronate N-acetyltransferase
VLNAAEESLRAGGKVVSLAGPGNGRPKTALSGRVLAQAVAAQVAVRAGAGEEGPAGTGPGRASDARNPGLPRNPPTPDSGVPASRAGAQVFRPMPHALEPVTRAKSPDAEHRPQATGAPDRFVHPTAIVDPGTEIGAGTKVWHFSHISKGCRIGGNNVFGQNVFVADNVKTGDNCKVQNNVSLYKGVVLEDDVFCGPSCVFTNVIDPRAFIEKKAEFKDTLVRRGASIGANATIVCGNTLGRYCLIGSGAVVTHDVPDYALVAGVPARRRGWVCKCGARLDFGQDSRSSAGVGSGPAPAVRTAACAKCGNQYELMGGRVQPGREE